jgi:hypothetical protein
VFDRGLRTWLFFIDNLYRVLINDRLILKGHIGWIFEGLAGIYVHYIEIIVLQVNQRLTLLLEALLVTNDRF